MLNGTVVRKSNMEDARLFRDGQGKFRMLFNRHFLVHPLRVSLQIAEVEIGSDNHVHLRNEQVMIFRVWIIIFSKSHKLR